MRCCQQLNTEQPREEKKHTKNTHIHCYNQHFLGESELGSFHLIWWFSIIIQHLTQSASSLSSTCLNHVYLPQTYISYKTVYITGDDNVHDYEPQFTGNRTVLSQHEQQICQKRLLAFTC